MSEQNFVKSHSLVIYFVLAFAIAWIGSFVLVGPKFLAGSVIEFSDIGLMAIAALVAPFTAGLLMTYLADGKLGIKDLFEKIQGGWTLVSSTTDLSSTLTFGFSAAWRFCVLRNGTYIRYLWSFRGTFSRFL